MYKLLTTLLVLLSLTSCCTKTNKKLPTKVEYLRVGFESGKEAYLRVSGTGIYKIIYDDELAQQNYEEAISCNRDNYQTIATNVAYFSVITEEEYNKKMQ